MGWAAKTPFTTREIRRAVPGCCPEMHKGASKRKKKANISDSEELFKLKNNIDKRTKGLELSHR